MSYLNAVGNDAETVNVDLLVVIVLQVEAVEVEVGLEVIDQGLHLGLFAERQEGDEPHEGLQHAGIGAHKRTVDAIQ